MTRLSSSLVVLVVLALACDRTTPPDPQPPVDAKVEAPSEVAPEPEPEPEPPAYDAAAVEAARERADRDARLACGVPEAQLGGEIAFAEARKYEGGEAKATFRFEGEAFTSDLELVVDAGGGIELRHPKRKALTGGGLSTCEPFYEGDVVGAQIIDHGPLGKRRLFEVWIGCTLGEDIRSIDSEVWLVASDGKTLERLWSTSASWQGSHACAEFDVVHVDRVAGVDGGGEVIVSRNHAGEIYEPGETRYDCEGAREFVEARGCERIALPSK
jgi:hypothetical protein